MKIIKQIINFFRNLYSDYKTRKIIKVLEPVYRKKVSERKQLVYDITRYIWKFRLVSKSKFLPLDYKTKAFIAYNVEKKYGDVMRKNNLKLNNKLQVV